MVIVAGKQKREKTAPPAPSESVEQQHLLLVIAAGRLKNQKASAKQTYQTATGLILHGLTARAAGKRARQ